MIKTRPTTFKDLPIGQVFEFQRKPGWLDLAHGPWRKVGERRYHHVDDETVVHTVGTVHTSVDPGSLRPNPATMTSLGHGKYRVSTPGRIKAFRTSRAKAQAQVRLLNAIENPAITELEPYRGFIYDTDWTMMGKHMWQFTCRDPECHKHPEYGATIYIEANSPRQVIIDKVDATIAKFREFPPAKVNPLPDMAYSKSGVTRSKYAHPLMLPPMYKLNALGVYMASYDQRKTAKLIEWESCFPLQITPRCDVDVDFMFFGTNRYDFHTAFKKASFDHVHVSCIHYCILINGKTVHFQHDFKQCVCFTLKGIKGSKHIMKAYKSLPDMPKLPLDWQYFQFID